MLHRTIKLTLAGLTLTAGAIGCQADATVKQGVVDEICRRDTDCRNPLICNEVTGLCQSTNQGSSALECPAGERPKGDVACADMCNYLVGECGRREDNCTGDECLDACIGSCEQTIRCWSAEASTTFGNCSLGNSEPQLTCDVAITSEAPSFCYSQIELPEDRKAVCDDLIAAVGDYSSAATQTELADLAKFCYRLARAYTEEDFSATYSCDDSRDPTLTPAEVVECVNTVFGMSFIPDDASVNNPPQNNTSDPDTGE